MHCPVCNKSMKVSETRNHAKKSKSALPTYAGAISRKRYCVDCGLESNTVEIKESLYTMLVANINRVSNRTEQK